MKVAAGSVVIAFLFAPFACGSTLILMRTDDGVLVAADAKVSNRRSEPEKPECKIHQFGSTFVGVVGLTRKAEIGFDSEQVVRVAAAAPSPLTSKADAFRSSAEKYMAAAVEYARKFDWTAYEQDYLGKRILDVTFVSMKGAEPEAIVQSFMVDRDGALHPQRSELGESYLMVTGRTSAIQAYNRDNSGWYQRLGPYVAIKRFMQLEIVAEPNAVGPPVAILKIDAAGAKWVEQGACPAIQK